MVVKAAFAEVASVNTRRNVGSTVVKLTRKWVEGAVG
jgi:hypothetical protein